nr:hypothetical protein [Bacillus cereus]
MSRWVRESNKWFKYAKIAKQVKCR